MPKVTIFCAVFMYCTHRNINVQLAAVSVGFFHRRSQLHWAKMVANGTHTKKTLNDCAPTNGKHQEPMEFPVCVENYGKNVLGVDDAVIFTLVYLAYAVFVCASFHRSPREASETKRDGSNG